MFISGYLILELNSSREEDKPNLEWENNVSRGGVGSLRRVTKKVGVIQLCLFQEQCVQTCGTSTENVNTLPTYSTSGQELHLRYVLETLCSTIKPASGRYRHSDAFQQWMETDFSKRFLLHCNQTVE